MSFRSGLIDLGFQQLLGMAQDHPGIVLTLSAALDASRSPEDRAIAAQKAYEDITSLIGNAEDTVRPRTLNEYLGALATLPTTISTLPPPPPPRPVVFERLQDTDTIRTYLKRFGIHGSMTAEEKSAFRSAVGVNVDTVLQYGIGGDGKEHKPSDVLILTKVCDYIRNHQQTPEQQSYGPRPDLLALAFLALPKTLAPLRDVIIETTALAEMPSEFFNINPEELLTLTQEKILGAFDGRRAEEWVITTEEGTTQDQDSITPETFKAHVGGKRHLTRAAPKTRATAATVLSPLGLAILEIAPLLPFLEIKVVGSTFHHKPEFQSSPMCIEISNKKVSRLDETKVDRKPADIHEFPLKDLLDPHQPLAEVLDEIQGRLQALNWLHETPDTKVKLLAEEIGVDTALRRVDALRRHITVAADKVTDYQDAEKRKAMPLNTPDKAADLVRRIIAFAWDMRETRLTTTHDQPTTSGHQRYTLHFQDDWPDGASLLEVIQDGINIRVPSRLLYFLRQYTSNARELLRLHIAFSLAGDALTENDIAALAHQIYPDTAAALAADYKKLRQSLSSQSASVRYGLTSPANRRAYDERQKRSQTQRGREHEKPSDKPSDKPTPDPEPDFTCVEKKEFPSKIISPLGPKLAQAFIERETKTSLTPEALKDILRDIPSEWLTAKKAPDDMTIQSFAQTRNTQRRLFLGRELFQHTDRAQVIDVVKRYVEYLRISHELYKKHQPPSIPLQKMIGIIAGQSLCQEKPIDLVLCAKKALGDEAPVNELLKCVLEYEKWQQAQTKKYSESFDNFDELLDLWAAEERDCIQQEVIPSLVSEGLLRSSWNIPKTDFPQKGEAQIPLRALAENLIWNPELDIKPRWSKVLSIVSQYPTARKTKLPERTFSSEAWALPETANLMRELKGFYRDPTLKDKTLVIYESAEGGVVGEMKVALLDKDPDDIESISIGDHSIAKTQIHFIGAVTGETRPVLDVIETAADDIRTLWTAYLYALPNNTHADVLKKALAGQIDEFALRTYLNEKLAKTKPEEHQVLVGAAARTGLWQSPSNTADILQQITHTELKQAASNLTSARSGLADDRDKLRRALFSNNSDGVSKASEAFYPDLVAYKAREWSSGNPDTVRHFTDCPEIFLYTSSGSKELLDRVSLIWSEECEKISQFQTTTKKSDLTDDHFRNLSLLIAARLPEFNQQEKNHHQSLLESFQAFRTLCPPAAAILALMYLGHFFHDTTHLTAVHRIITSGKKTPVILADLVRYYFRYRDEIRHRLNSTRGPLESMIRKDHIPSAERPFGDQHRPAKTFHEYDEARAILHLREIFPGEMDMETSIAQDFLRRAFCCREAHEAWGEAIEIINYVRSTGNKGPFRDLALVITSSMTPSDMDRAIKSVYDKYKIQIFSSNLGGMTGSYIEALELNTTYRTLDDWNLEELRRDWPGVVQSIQDQETAVVMFRIGNVHQVNVKTMSQTDWSAHVDASDRSPLSDQFMIVANQDNCAPYTLVVSAKHPFIQALSKALDQTDAQTRNPLLDIIFSWSLWGTLSIDEAYPFYEVITDLLNDSDKEINEEISKESVNRLKKMAHRARRIKSRYDLLGPQLFGGYLSNAEPASLDAATDITSSDKIPMALDWIGKIELSDEEKAPLKDLATSINGDDLIKSLDAVLHKAGEKIFAEQEGITQRWLDQLGAGIDIHSMPELILFNRRLIPLLDSLEAEIYSDSQAARVQYDRLWKDFYQTYAQHYSIFRLLAVIIFLLGLSGVLFEDEVLNMVKDLEPLPEERDDFLESQNQKNFKKLYSSILGLYKSRRIEILWRIYENKGARNRVNLKKPEAEAFPITATNAKLKDIGYAEYAKTKYLWVTVRAAISTINKDPKGLFLSKLFDLAESDPNFKPIFVFYLYELKDPNSTLTIPAQLPRPSDVAAKRRIAAQQLSQIIERYAA